MRVCLSKVSEAPGTRGGGKTHDLSVWNLKNKCMFLITELYFQFHTLFFHIMTNPECRLTINKGSESNKEDASESREKLTNKGIFPSFAC